jgi:hypothetical protein
VGGGTVGIGGQIGDPSGLSLKFYGGGNTFRAWDFLLAWDTGGEREWFFVNVHGHRERPLSGAPVNFFYGPGLFVGTSSRDGDDDEVLFGVSADFGLAFEIDRFDIFGRLTPRLEVVPDTDGSLGLGVGARFYF